MSARDIADLKTAILNPSQPVASNSVPAMFQGTNDNGNGNAVSMAPSPQLPSIESVLGAANLSK